MDAEKSDTKEKPRLALVAMIPAALVATIMSNFYFWVIYAFETRKSLYDTFTVEYFYTLNYWRGVRIENEVYGVILAFITCIVVAFATYVALHRIFEKDKK